MNTMNVSMRPLGALALAIGLLATIPAAAGASADPSGAWSEPLGGPSIIDGTGEQAELGFEDSIVTPPTNFSTQATGDVVTISGAGNGHGVGMSQWGSQGRALAGQDFGQILSAYYQGTTVMQDPSNDPLWVNLEDELVKVQLKIEENVAGGAPVVVTRDDTGAYGGLLEQAILTPGDTLVVEYLDRVGPIVAPINNPRRCTFSTFAAGTDPATAVPTFAAGEGSCVIDLEWDGWNGNPTTRVVIDKRWEHDTPAASGLDCVHTIGTALDCAYSRGEMHIRPDDYDESEPNDIGFNVVQELSLDDYARGIGEMPYSWNGDALKAQAIAARSYARYMQQVVRADPVNRQWCWCSIYDTSIDQVYLGWGFDEVAQFGAYAANWVAAVNETAGKLLLSNGQYVSTNYSASNGGASENNEDIWGSAPKSYLRSTPDPLDLNSGNWARAWTRSVPIDYFAAKVGLDTVQSAKIVSTYVSGSPSDIAVSGIKNGAAATRHYTATQFMALFSGTEYRIYAPRILSIDVPDVAPPPPPPVEFQIDRWWGRDRYVTAVEVSKANFPTGAGAVFIATGENFPDALAAAPLAYNRNAPVLLSKTSIIPQETIDEIRRLDPDRIYVLGGTAAVSAGVVTRLEGYAPVTRVWGPDRYATAAEISKATYPGGSDVVYVATGRNFPDALVGAPVAGYKGGPILLSDGAALTGATLSELARLAPNSIVVVGAGTSVSQAVVDQLKAYAPVVGVSGSDRYETSVKMSQQAFGSAGVVFIATGGNFPDALAAGPAAIDAGGPVLLVSTTSLPASVAAELVRLDPDRIVILGGTAAVSVAVEEAIDALLD